MKTIKNCQTEVTDATGTLDRKGIFKLIINAPSPQGINIQVMRERFRILDVLEKSEGEDIVLEDSDFNTLKKLFENFGFVKPHKHLTELADHLEEVSKQKNK